MKLLILFMSLVVPMLTSCRKTGSDNIGGTWKMIIVENAANFTSITKPAEIEKTS